MTIRDCLRDSLRKLQRAGIPDPKTDGEYLLSYCLGRPRMELLLDASCEISKEQERLFQSLLLSRVQRMPLQYLLGREVFYGLELQVDERVLIPRPETELLTEEALKRISGIPRPKLLDLCSGSGAIALAVAHERPNAEVYASDISREALTVAEANGKRLGLSVHWIESDLLEQFSDMRFDAIVSNPPYIPTAECMNLQAEVQREPLLALDGGADGLDICRRILKEAPLHLLPGGWLLIECGNEETEKLSGMMKDRGFTGIEIKTDLEHQPRMVLGQWMEGIRDAGL